MYGCFPSKSRGLRRIIFLQRSLIFLRCFLVLLLRNLQIILPAFVRRGFISLCLILRHDLISLCPVFRQDFVRLYGVLRSCLSSSRVHGGRSCCHDHCN